MQTAPLANGPAQDALSIDVVADVQVAVLTLFVPTTPLLVAIPRGCEAKEWPRHVLAS